MPSRGLTACTRCRTPHLRGTRCPTCAPRPGPRQRGYDTAYDHARADALEGATRCATCGGSFTPDNPATGGHVRDLRHGGTTADGVMAQCRRCNFGWRAREQG